MLDPIKCAALAGITPEELIALSEKANKTPELMTPEDVLLLRSAIPEQERACGSCTLCCHAPAIEGAVLRPSDNMVEKPACQKCPSQKEGGGCARYDSRPDICRDYHCLWSMGHVPEEFSPLAIGVAWTVQSSQDPKEEKGLIMGHTLDMEKAIKNPNVLQCVSAFLEMGPFVGVTIRDDRHVICFQPHGYARARISQKDPMKMRILEETTRSHPYV